MRWQDKLTKKELAHVREWGGRTLTGFKYNRKKQTEMREQRGFEQCMDCRMIALKLGIEKA